MTVLFVLDCSLVLKDSFICLGLNIKVNQCVNRFLNVITFLMGLSTEVSSSLGFN